MIVTAIVEYCKKQFCLFSVFDFETAHPECKRYQKFEYTRASVISDYQWQKQICEIRIAKCKSGHTLALVIFFEFLSLSVFNKCICIESSQKILEVQLWYAKRIWTFLVYNLKKLSRVGILAEFWIFRDPAWFDEKLKTIDGEANKWSEW